jgi:hypothetical protein
VIYASNLLLLSTKIHHNSRTYLINANTYIGTCDIADMSDFSPLVFKDSGSDQVKQVRRVGVRNCNNGENDRQLSPQQLFIQILHTITEATENKLLTYEGVDPETGSLVVDSLRQDREVERARPK